MVCQSTGAVGPLSTRYLVKCRINICQYCEIHDYGGVLYNRDRGGVVPFLAVNGKLEVICTKGF